MFLGWFPLHSLLVSVTPLTLPRTLDGEVDVGLPSARGSGSLINQARKIDSLQKLWLVVKRVFHESVQQVFNT